MKLTGYTLLCRRDRKSNSKGGGIAVFVLSTKNSKFTLLDKVVDSERCWILTHTDEGPILLACWYRPPCRGNTECIRAMVEELKVHRQVAVGTAIIGDINVHSRRWLTFSSGETPEGTMLHDVCMEEGLRQIVAAPTRNENLLDLVLTDIPDTEATVGGKIQDHKFVLTKFNFRVPETEFMPREVWNYSKADWRRLKDLPAEHN